MVTVDRRQGVTGSPFPHGGNVRSLNLTTYACIAAFICLMGCADARVTVHDQGTGVAVVQARAVELRADGDLILADADDHGRLALRLPTDDHAIVAVRAEGFVQWSKSVAWLRAQHMPLTIHLEPVWMAGFLHTGKKPSNIIVRGPCLCSPPKAK